MLARLAPARRRMVMILGVFLLIAALAISLFGVLNTGADSADRKPVDQSTPGPVILIPGYGGSTASLRALAASLSADGRRTQVLDLPGDGTGDLDDQAVLLGDTARALLASSGASSVDVVGYSAGGVVARLWVRDHGGDSVARRVISLGSPQHGTTIAKLAADLATSQCPAACQQLVPGSDLLRALNSRDETPAGPVFISVWTTRDDVVLPPDSARLEGGTNIVLQDVCPSATVKHSGLPQDPVVLDLVRTALRPQVPSPADFAAAGTSCGRS